MVTTTGAGRTPLAARTPFGTGTTRSVLVCVDGSDATWLALAWAGKHASALGAELVVVGLGGDVRRQAVQRRAGAPVRFRRGDLGTVHSMDCGTLVVGRHGEPFHPRSVGAAVQTSSRTLVVVRGLPTAVRGDPPVVTAAVGGAADDNVLTAAVEISRALDAGLRLLHVHPDFGGAAEATIPDYGPLRRATEQLDALAPDVTPEIVLDRRQPHDAMATPVSGLLVVGRGRDGGLSRIAKAALYHSSCPVLIPSQ